MSGAPRGLLRLSPLVLLLASGFLFPATAASPAMRNLEVGQNIIPFSLPDRDGTLFDSASLAGGPAAVLFWSTWSPRSADLLQDFRRYYQEYGPRGLKVVAVNIEGENLSSSQRQAILDYAARLELPFPVLLDDGLSVFAAYGVVAHPSTLLADGGGKVTYLLGGYPNTLRSELKDEIEKLLGIYREPPKETVTETGYVPKNGALQMYNLGKNLMQMGQVDKALGYFDRALERDPEYAEPAVAAARGHLLNGDLEKGEERLGKIGAQAMARDDVRFLTGYLALLKGRTEDARSLFAQLAEKSPAAGWGWYGLGLAALAAGDAAAAVPLLAKGHEIQPVSLEAESFLHGWAKGYYLRGQAVPEEEKLVALFPSLAATRERYRNLFGSGGAAPQP